jgi:hypothetical protein
MKPRTKKTDPRRDVARLQKLRKALEKPMTIAQIMVRFGLSQRTAYRWLGYLQADGTRVLVERSKGEAVTYWAWL